MNPQILTFLMLGIISYAEGVALSYLILRADFFKCRQRWTKRDRIITLGFSVFGPLILAIALIEILVTWALCALKKLFGKDDASW